MPISDWLVYVVTVLVLMSTPGPSHLLMLSNSLQHGLSRSWLTAAGDLSANALQMLAAGLGLAVLVTRSSGVFVVVKWLGVAWLLWLGWRMLSDHRAIPSTATTSKLWWQGFATSAANPKAVVFFAALFPQFIQPALPFWQQLGVLSLTYLVIDGLFLLAYGATATVISRRVNQQRQRLISRVGGTMLIVAAVLLGLRQIE